MVCTGNICRSPTMEAVLRRRADLAGWRVVVDSAGTTDWHAGEPPDPRTVAAGEAAGYALAHLRARRVADEDFLRFDLLLAADQGHREWLLRRAPRACRDKVRLFLADDAEVPDPYYGPPEGFAQVLRLVETRAAAWNGRIGFF